MNIFPDNWKAAKIIPLQKDADKCNVSNLWHVSLLPLPGKLLERIIHGQITAYLDDNNILIPNQGGFRKGHSTINTIAQFTDDIISALNNKESVQEVYVDFKKVFDTKKSKKSKAWI